ncbi:hypothetical protein AU190_05805 [Mycolicibacterium acapulense]|nr:hypothetical protein AU190_05805 [Mycolicibacterium acapulense]
MAATLPVPLDELPDQAGLDHWASEHTRGLIEQFPLEVDPLTALVLATALVLQPRWTTKLGSDEKGRLVLDGGLQTIVDTTAAGLVAVAKPFSEDGVDVVSVIAAPDISPAEVWRAVDEVIAKLNEGALWHGGVPADGHAWTVRETTETFLAWDAPGDYEYLWRSHLPRWEATVQNALTGAPGVAELAASFAEAVPGLDGAIECVQGATAAYDEYGFEAAAVTALAMATGAPQLVERTIHRVEVTFDRPHAVVAVARGGPGRTCRCFTAGSRPEDLLGTGGGRASRASGGLALHLPRRLGGHLRGGVQQLLVVVPHAPVRRQIVVDLLAAQRSRPDVLAGDLDPTVVGLCALSGANAEACHRYHHQDDQAGPDDPGHRTLRGQRVHERSQCRETQQQAHVPDQRRRNPS